MDLNSFKASTIEKSNTIKLPMIKKNNNNNKKKTGGSHRIVHNMETVNINNAHNSETE